MSFPEDLSVFFDAAAFAVPATWGAQSANVILNTPAEEILGGRVLSDEITATLPFVHFAAIKRGDVIEISGTSYAVKEVRKLSDGAIKELLLGRQ